MATNNKDIQTLPFGSEFSPNQVDLPNLLEICKNHEGNQVHIEKAIIDTFYSDKTNDVKKLGNNCFTALRHYKILDDNGVLTEIGNNLYEHRKDNTLYWIFAKHILLHLNGLLFIECLKDMHLAGKKVTLENMRKSLTNRGLIMMRGSKSPSIMRLWLDKTGLIDKQWNIDEDVLTNILGTENPTSTLAELNNLQVAFLKALINSDIKTKQSASEIVKLAQNIYGLDFPEKSLPKLVLNKLKESNLIIAEKSTMGRGAKPFLVQLHPDVDIEVIQPTLAQLRKRLSPDLLELTRKSLPDILTDIKSKDTYTSGLALEALAFKLMQIFDIKYIKTRLRDEQTGGAEVDLLFESSRLVYSRWQIQCKNTKKVSLDAVAKEVGLTHVLKSNVILVVTTGDFTSEARKYSNIIMKDSNLNIVLLNGKDLQKVSHSPSAIIDILNREAKHAMEIKRIDDNA